MKYLVAAAALVSSISNGHGEEFKSPVAEPRVWLRGEPKLIDDHAQLVMKPRIELAVNGVCVSFPSRFGQIQIC